MTRVNPDGDLGKRGMATFNVNGESVAEGRVEKTQPNIFSADETADVGIDNQTRDAGGIGRIREVALEVR